MITNLFSKQLTFCQATWDGIGFVPGLLAGVDTVELVVRLIDTEDLSAELKKRITCLQGFFTPVSVEKGGFLSPFMVKGSRQNCETVAVSHFNQLEGAHSHFR